MPGPLQKVLARVGMAFVASVWAKLTTLAWVDRPRTPLNVFAATPAYVSARRLTRVPQGTTMGLCQVPLPSARQLLATRLRVGLPPRAFRVHTDKLG